MNRRGVLLSLLLSASALIIVFSIPSELFAQRHPIEFYHSGDDTIGQRIAYQVREMIQTSATLGPYNGKDYAWFRVRMTTMSTDTPPQNLLSCYAVVLTGCYRDGKTKMFSEFYLTNWVGLTGTQKVRDAAERIIAGVSSEVESMNKAGK